VAYETAWQIGRSSEVDVSVWHCICKQEHGAKEEDVHVCMNEGDSRVYVCNGTCVDVSLRFVV